MSLDIYYTMIMYTKLVRDYVQSIGPGHLLMSSTPFGFFLHLFFVALFDKKKKFYYQQGFATLDNFQNYAQETDQFDLFYYPTHAPTGEQHILQTFLVKIDASDKKIMLTLRITKIQCVDGDIKKAHTP